ncbi:N-acetyltransferase ESCO2-like [Ornithodoros turicata]|uniref:N-acetyltransferase ESCO2-like n=1 Tax=Ornithodoros turicata TaxID=34597 RepID=UPI0031390F8E
MYRSTVDDPVDCSIEPPSFYSKNSDYKNPLERKRLRALNPEPNNRETTKADEVERSPPKKYATKTRKIKTASKSSRKMSSAKKTSTKPETKLQEKNAEKTIVIPLQCHSNNVQENDGPPAKKRRFFSGPPRTALEATKRVVCHFKKSWNSGFSVRPATAPKVSRPTRIRPSSTQDPGEICTATPTKESDNQMPPCKEDSACSGNQKHVIEQDQNWNVQDEKENDATQHVRTTPLLARTMPCMKQAPDKIPTKSTFARNQASSNEVHDRAEIKAQSVNVTLTIPNASSTATGIHAQKQPSDIDTRKSSVVCIGEADDLTLNAGSANSVGAERPLFPVFCKKAREKTSDGTGTKTIQTKFQKKFLRAALDPLQLIIDAGQQKFGAVTCPACGMTYSAGDADDEVAHLQYHQKELGTVKFLGWKNEHVVDVGLTSDSRIVMVRPSDKKHMLDKVKDIRKRVERDLGPEAEAERKAELSHFIYVKQKEVVGYLSAASITEAYRVVRRRGAKSSESMTYDPEPVAACCGVSRIWVADSHRRKKVATKLLDCLRKRFFHGELVDPRQLAFSVPSAMGQRLAASYCKTEEFLIYW